MIVYNTNPEINAFPDVTIDMLYRNCTRFYIEDVDENITQIVEPVGWDAVEMNLKRDFKSGGVTFSFSSGDTTLRLGLKSPGPGIVCGKELIDSIYKNGGVDSKAKLLFGLWEEETTTFTALYVGEVDFSFYESNPYFTTIQIREQQFDDKLINRFDTVIDAVSTTTLDDEDAAQVPEVLQTLPSQFETLQTNTRVTDEDLIYNQFNIGVDTVSFTFAPSTVEINDIGTYTAHPLTLSNNLVLPQVEFFTPDIETLVTFTFDARLFIDYPIQLEPAENIDVIMYFVHKDAGLVDKETFSFPMELVGVNGNIRDFRGSGTFTIKMAATDKLFFVGNVLNFEVVGITNDMIMTVPSGGANFWSMSAEIFKPWSNANTIKAFDLGEAISERILGQSGRFQSSLLSTDATQYLYFTNGLRIRALTDDRRFETSLKDFFDTLRGIMATGYAFETDGTNEFIRLEKYEYFFQDVATLELINRDISDYKQTGFEPLSFKNIKTGYTFSVDSDGRELAKDSFHGDLERTLGLVNANASYEALVPGTYGADTYAIFDTQTNYNDDTTTTHDNDLQNFILSCKDTAEWSFLEALGLTVLWSSFTITVTGVNLYDFKVGDTIEVYWLNLAISAQAEITAVAQNIGANISTVYTVDAFQNVAEQGAFALTNISSSFIRPENQSDDFTISSVLASSKHYNLRYSPLRLLANHAKIIRSSTIFKNQATATKYLNGLNNTEAVVNMPALDRLDTDAIPLTGKQQDDDVLLSELSAVDALFVPIKHTFSVFLTYKEIEQVRRSMLGNDQPAKYGYISFFDPIEKINKKGFLLDMVYNFSSGKTTLGLIESATPF